MCNFLFQLVLLDPNRSLLNHKIYNEVIAALQELVLTAGQKEELQLLHDLQGTSAFLIRPCVRKSLLAV